MGGVHPWVRVVLGSAAGVPALVAGLAFLNASCNRSTNGASDDSPTSASAAGGTGGTSSPTPVAAAPAPTGSTPDGQGGRSEALAPPAALDSPGVERPAAGGAEAAASADGGLSAPPIVALFNGVDLTGWTAYRETSRTTPGTRLSAAEAAVIFKPEGGSIRVYGDAESGSTQARHTLVTNESYSKYNLFLEYRWGTKAFAPYANLAQYPRDAGILFHIHGDETIVWPSSIEFQIKDGTTGDIYALFARCTSLAEGPNGTTFVPADAGGTSKVVNGATGYVQHSRRENFELPEWNSLKLEVDGGAATYVVNGQVVNQVLSVSDSSGMVGVPISAGPIALQAEHAEVFYRNVRIQVFP